MNIILLLDVVWIIVCTFSVYSFRTRLPGGEIGGPIAWLLLVILGIILIHLLVPAAGTVRPL